MSSRMSKSLKRRLGRLFSCEHHVMFYLQVLFLNHFSHRSCQQFFYFEVLWERCMFCFWQSKLVQEASGWSSWLSSFVSVLPGLAPSSGGICTQSLLAVLKAHSARSGWRSLELGSLLLQIGSLLNRQREDAKVSWHTATC